MKGSFHLRITWKLIPLGPLDPLNNSTENSRTKEHPPTPVEKEGKGRLTSETNIVNIEAGPDVSPWSTRSAVQLSRWVMIRLIRSVIVPVRIRGIGLLRIQEVVMRSAASQLAIWGSADLKGLCLFVCVFGRLGGSDTRVPVYRGGSWSARTERKRCSLGWPCQMQTRLG